MWTNKRKENPLSWAQLTLPADRLATQSASMEVFSCSHWLSVPQGPCRQWPIKKQSSTKYQKKLFSSSSFPLPLCVHMQRDASHPISPHTLIHLPPPCTPSLPPTAHHLLHLIITPSTSPLLLPWQQQCWAQVPVSPVVTRLPLTTTIYYIKIKPTCHIYKA